jgi:allophanate hydrolase subunit 2
VGAALKVVRPGLFDTLQDLGRTGFMALGMPTAGAMDRIGLRLANALLGNPPGMAAIEIGVMGPDLMVEARTACGSPWSGRSRPP